MSKVQLETKGLDNFLAALEGTAPKGRVGILGGGARDGGGPTNAEIGSYHEFGRRSFLRIPILNHLNRYIRQDGKKNMQAIVEQVIETGSLRDAVQYVTSTAEAVVIDGFESGGFGDWPPSDMTNKKVHMTLVETTQLRDSITSEVE